MVMWLLDYSFNVYTLLAMILAIGLVVDDAIIIVENCYRHFCEGINRKASAVKTVKELRSAIVVMTLTLLVVYIPVAFSRDLVGKLFSPFCFTLAASIIVSGIVALTFSPMLCVNVFPKKPMNFNRVQHVVNKLFLWLQNSYKFLLGVVLKMRWLIILIGIVIYVASFFIQMNIQRALLPQEDQGYFATLSTPPITASMKSIQSHMALLAKRFLDFPSVERVVSVDQGNYFLQSMVVLKPWSQRNITAMGFINKYRKKFQDFPGFPTSIYNPGVLPNATQTAVEFSIELSTAGSYLELHNALQILIKKMREWGGVTDLNYGLKFNQPQINVDIDRNQADEIGVSPQEISSAISMFFTQPRLSQVSYLGRSYPVYAQIDLPYQRTPKDINLIHVATNSGKLVPLSTVTHTSTVVLPQQLSHFQYQRSTSLSGSLAKGVGLIEAIKHVRLLAKKYLPHNVFVSLSGRSRQAVESLARLYLLIIASLVFIYFIMAIQFNSFIAPIVVLITVPLAFFGALLCLWLVGGTLNVFTIIGLITLIGLITKHGILILTLIRQARQRGEELKDAIIIAASLRFRPILMTTLAIVLTAVPLIAIPGEGTNALHQVGWVIFGGMLIGTFFTLFVLPCVSIILLPKKFKMPAKL